MIKVDVTLSDDTLSQLRSALAGLGSNSGGKVMPATKRAFNQAARLIQKSWQNWANGGSIAGAADIKNPNPRLASSIKLRSISDFDVSIETDSRYMERIQQGRDEIRMKDENSPWLKSRMTRVIQHGKNKGKPYLIIPFRWGTPNDDGSPRAHFSVANTIDLKSYKILKHFEMSKRNGGTHFEKNIYDEDVMRHDYDWGDRLSAEDAASENEAGMVRMLDDKKNRPTSVYFTFRVISAQSKADWRIKAVPPNDVIGAIEKNLRSEVEGLIQEGLYQELGL